MKQTFTLLIASMTCVLFSMNAAAQGGSVPEILYYKFNQTGTTVTNEASSPPAGTATATIMGGQSQGSTGLCGSALIGTGGSSNSDYVNTGWNTTLGSGAWTIAFWINNMPSSTSLFYQFGDPSASSFRCFNNGVAGAGNFMLRGPITDVPCTGCAPVGVPSMTVFVYDPVAGNIKSYHDGVLNSTVSQSALNISGADFKVGGYSSSTGMGSGQLMDEFRFYNRALDAQEVNDTYMACLPLVMLNNDAGITDFVNPLIPTCTFNDSVAVTLRNFGTDTLTSASINWSLNGVNQLPAFWTGSLAPLADTTVFVGTVSYSSGDDLCAWSSNPNGVVENPAGSFNDSTCIFGLLTGLSGPYTIGGTTPDFPDILSAVAAMNFAGICGPTTFNLRSATYFDQFDLGQVTGMDATNTVTFRSEAGHRDSVIIDYGGATSSNNYVVLLNNADYFRFESMTLRNSGASYGRVFDIQGGSDYNEFTDLAIVTQANSSTSTFICPIFSGNGSNDEYNKFDNCSIVGGSYGAYWYGSGTTSLEKGSEFLNCEFVDNYYTGLRMYYQEGVHAIGNRMHGASTYTTRYGLYAYYCDKASVITHNVIEGSPTSYWYYGIYIGYNDGSAANRGLIANNSVTAGNLTNTTSFMYAFYFNQSGFQDVYNNTFNMAGGSSSSRTAYISGGGANNFKNNSFTHFADGLAMYVIGTYAINEMDYNNLKTTGPVLAYFDGTNCADLAAWQTASGYDANGISVDPVYYSDFDLHVCADSLNSKGTPLALITDDREGQIRNAATPDIGSDEFAPLGLPGFLGPDALVCTGQTVSLAAGAPADDVLWSTGDTTNTLVVTTPGTYTVSVIGTCGIAFDTVVVTASALAYTGYLVADTMTFCTGGSALLTSTMPATTYSWTGGSTNDSLVVTTGGTYTLNISDACGSGTESVVITENSVPVAGFTATSSFLTNSFTNTSTGGGNPTYAWNFGDGSTSTQMSPIHTYTTVGTFTVTLTVTNACGTNTFTGTVTSSNLGLEEVEGVGTIAVYPNPSNGVFQIDFNTNNDMNITVLVTNVLGESVLVKNIGSVNGTHNDAIDITNAAPGVYYVTILSNNEKVMTSKLIKQ